MFSFALPFLKFCFILSFLFFCAFDILLISVGLSFVLCSLRQCDWFTFYDSTLFAILLLFSCLYLRPCRFYYNASICLLFFFANFTCFFATLPITFNSLLLSHRVATFCVATRTGSRSPRPIDMQLLAQL